MILSLSDDRVGVIFIELDGQFENICGFKYELFDGDELLTLNK